MKYNIENIVKGISPYMNRDGFREEFYYWLDAKEIITFRNRLSSHNNILVVARTTNTYSLFRFFLTDKHWEVSVDASGELSTVIDKCFDLCDKK